MISIYDKKPSDYFMRQWEDLLPKHFWYKVRQRYILQQVEKYHLQGGIIIDLGCGNNVWNKGLIPVLGMDSSIAMLEYNLKRNNSFFPVAIDLEDGIPLKNSSVDLIVITDVMEYIPSYYPLIDEIWRILRNNGTVIASVPYSRLPGLWPIVFPLWCKLNVWLYRDKFCESYCGHIVTFNKKSMLKAFRKFDILSCNSLGLMTIFCICRKKYL